MKHLWTMLTLVIIFIGSNAVAADDERTVAFEIDKMTCATCPITVRTAMRRVDGVKTVNVDLDSKTATVTYDAGVTTPSEIASASTNVGFPATAIDEGGA